MRQRRDAQGADTEGFGNFLSAAVHVEVHNSKKLEGGGDGHAERDSGSGEGVAHVPFGETAGDGNLRSLASSRFVLSRSGRLGEE